jgi:hypothetical protein
MRYLTFLAALLLPLLVWAAASELSTSRQTLVSGEDTKVVQLIRCDDEAQLTGDSAAGGETCEAGDWSVPVDCRNYRTLTAYFHEYNTVGGRDCTAKIWNCQTSVGFTANMGGDPSADPNRQTPYPLCVDMTTDVTGDSMTGVASTIAHDQVFYTWGDTVLGYIVGEIDTDPNGCSATLIVGCGR